jgi:hypothetical protein
METLTKKTKSITDDTFKELDEKFSGILNEETINYIKGKILWHISEAYNRGKYEK